jgi:hypothetical protein
VADESCGCGGSASACLLCGVAGVWDFPQRGSGGVWIGLYSGRPANGSVAARGVPRPGACTGCGAACMAPPRHGLRAGRLVQSALGSRAAPRATGRAPLTGGRRDPVPVAAAASRSGGTERVRGRRGGAGINRGPRTGVAAGDGDADAAGKQSRLWSWPSGADHFPRHLRSRDFLGIYSISVGARPAASAGPTAQQN